MAAHFRRLCSCAHTSFHITPYTQGAFAPTCPRTTYTFTRHARCVPNMEQANQTSTSHRPALLTCYVTLPLLLINSKSYAALRLTMMQSLWVIVTICSNIGMQTCSFPICILIEVTPLIDYIALLSEHCGLPVTMFAACGPSLQSHDVRAEMCIQISIHGTSQIHTITPHRIHTIYQRSPFSLLLAVFFPQGGIRHFFVAKHEVGRRGV